MPVKRSSHPWVGCVRIPDFPVQAELARRPELRGRPVVITAPTAGGAAAKAPVTHCSLEAAEQGVRPGMPVHDEELFAPIAPVVVVDDEATALEIVNSTPYGLSASVFSRDLDRAWAFADRVRAGMVHVNDASALHEPHVPFGGVGESGVGERFGGRASIDLLTERRWTSLQRSAVVR